MQQSKEVFNPEDTDGNKIRAAIGHLVEAQAPLNWRQMKRLGLSIRPTDDKGRIDDRGNQYEFLNELAGSLNAVHSDVLF